METLKFKLLDGFPPKTADGVIEVYAPMRMNVKKKTKLVLDVGLTFDRSVVVIPVFGEKARVIPKGAKVGVTLNSGDDDDLLVEEKQIVGHVLVLANDIVLENDK